MKRRRLLIETESDRWSRLHFKTRGVEHKDAALPFCFTIAG